MSSILVDKWLLDRRRFLRGVGASVALPLLNCMVPWRAKAAEVVGPSLVSRERTPDSVSESSCEPAAARMRRISSPTACTKSVTAVSKFFRAMRPK